MEGRSPVENKYGNERTKRYASKYQAEIAGRLYAMQTCGIIHDLREEVPIQLVPGQGKIRPITYRADFTWRDKEKNLHVGDAKGCKTPIYRLKRKLAALLLGIEIEEL